MRLLALILILSCTTAFAQQQYVDKTKKTTQKAIIVSKAKPYFSVTLDNNPSTGYGWFIKAYDSNLIQLVGRKPVAKQQSGFIGSGSKEEWTFMAKTEAFVAPHLLTITMLYTRPWQMDAGTTKTITVVTED